MEKLGLLLAFMTLFSSIIYLAGVTTGENYIKVIVKSFGIVGVISSIVYIFKYFNLI